MRWLKGCELFLRIIWVYQIPMFYFAYGTVETKQTTMLKKNWCSRTTMASCRALIMSIERKKIVSPSCKLNSVLLNKALK